MSRVGKSIINIPDNVKVELKDRNINIESSSNKLNYMMPEGINLEIKDNTILLSRENDSTKLRGLHGLCRALVNNMIIGVTSGFTKRLSLVGRGKRAKVQGKELILEIGLSHPINFQIPGDIEINIEKNIIEIKGIDKQKVGEIAAEIRCLQPPEPYKGSGIRYENEYVRKKAGKSAVGGGFTGSGK